MIDQFPLPRSLLEARHKYDVEDQESLARIRWLLLTQPEFFCREDSWIVKQETTLIASLAKRSRIFDLLAKTPIHEGYADINC